MTSREAIERAILLTEGEYLKDRLEVSQSSRRILAIQFDRGRFNNHTSRALHLYLVKTDKQETGPVGCFAQDIARDELPNPKHANRQINSEGDSAINIVQHMKPLIFFDDVSVPPILLVTLWLVHTFSKSRKPGDPPMPNKVR